MYYTIVLVLFIVEFIIPQPKGYILGNSYWGKSRFVEYFTGDMPVIISVPHDGNVRQELIPDRSFGVNARDNGTQVIAREIIEVFKERTGKYPHVIFSHLVRKKLDMNREEFEAAQENETALTAWNEYHGFIDSACAAARTMFGKGFLIDLHGQNHPEGRIELGYRLENDELMGSDDRLNSNEFVGKSSLKNLKRMSPMTHAELIRGKYSLGALFDSHGVRSSPSPSEPCPESYKYFSGGYTIFRHASEDTTTIFGAQFELDPALRKPGRTHATAVMLVDVIIEFLNIHFGEHFVKNN